MNNSFDANSFMNAGQEVIDEFSNRLSIPVGIFVPHESGSFYSYSTGFQPFCKAVRSTEIGEKLCTISHTNVMEATIGSIRPVKYRCHCGLTHIATPIVDNSSQLGIIFSGQFRENTWSTSEYQWLQSRVADFAVIPRDQLLSLHASIPLYSNAHIHGLEEAIIKLARNIAKTSQISSHIHLSDVIEIIEELTPDLIAHLKKQNKDLWRLPWDVFEHLIAEFFASWGFSTVKLVGRSKQTAADIFAVEQLPHSGVSLRCFIEVKRTKQKVGLEIVDRVYGAMIRERPKLGYHVAMICSLSGFKNFRNNSPQKLRLTGVELRGHDEILQWLRDYKLSGKGLWLPKSIALEPIEPRNEEG